MVELAQPLAGDRDDLAMAVAQDGAHLARREVEDAPAVGIGEIVAGRALGDHRREGAAITHEMRARLPPELRIAVAGHAASHAARTSGRRSLPKNIDSPMNMV